MGRELRLLVRLQRRQRQQLQSLLLRKLLLEEQHQLLLLLVALLRLLLEHFRALSPLLLKSLRCLKSQLLRKNQQPQKNRLLKKWWLQEQNPLRLLLVALLLELLELEQSLAVRLQNLQWKKWLLKELDQPNLM